MNFLLIQIIGIIAYILIAISYFEKEKKNILLIQIVALTAFTLHYQFLHGITGAVCNLLSAITMLVIFIYDLTRKNNKNVLLFVILPVTAVISFISYENIYSLLPIIASIIMLFAFLQENENKIRIIGLISNLLWTIYAVIYMSYFSIVFEVFAVISTIIAIYTNREKKK